MWTAVRTGKPDTVAMENVGSHRTMRVTVDATGMAGYVTLAEVMTDGHGKVEHVTWGHYPMADLPKVMETGRVLAYGEDPE